MEGINMGHEPRRGYSPGDEREFRGDLLQKCCSAAKDLSFLLNRGYALQGAAAFVGNHYLLSKRQRVAIMRSVASAIDIQRRKAKEILPEQLPADIDVHLDGFNTIITLEVALSASPVLRCMDGTFRDLAGLRGTYRVIDQTRAAIRMILGELDAWQVRSANFFLDAPVSNSGRLKCCIAELGEAFHVAVNIEVINDVDRELYKLPAVITSDGIILDRCVSWINLNDSIAKKIPDLWAIKLL